MSIPAVVKIESWTKACGGVRRWPSRPGVGAAYCVGVRDRCQLRGVRRVDPDLVRDAVRKALLARCQSAKNNRKAGGRYLRERHRSPRRDALDRVQDR